ncbi:MAG: ComEC family competence protein [Alphaproteobacteria bacterium]|nr:ComEC family competence protein [Alphaproteobacteria bacterium]MCW5740101.1 ComEC family competence protein [Alphaproteobacteria bacterium]
MSLAATPQPGVAATGHGPAARFVLAVAERLGAERERWALWTPVALGLGIAVYFELPSEPPLWLGVAVTMVGLLLCAARSAAPALLAIGVTLAAGGLGFAAATWRTHSVAAPVLARAYFGAVEGRVVEIGMLPEGRRVLLDQVVLRGVKRTATPQRVRLSVTRVPFPYVTGDRVAVSAVLHPPAGPAMPGAFDFQRFAWFQRLGAVGYATGTPALIERGQPTGATMRIDEMRRALTERITAALPGDTGAYAAAILTGDRNGLSKEAQWALRDSGLAHIIAISGLHMAFAAGLMLGLVRYGLALVPGIALRYPVKKIAAVAALLGGAFYLVLAGAPVPAQRAFGMLAIVLIGVLADRTGLTLRLVCWAAAVILLIQPESLAGASFQLSFAAVVALVAAWEVARLWRARRHAEGVDRAGGMRQRVGRYLADSVMTTLVASLATAGFAVYHFNRLSLVGIVANLLVVPLTGIWVMPWGLLAMLLAPLGLEWLALVPMGWGIELTHDIARWASALPGAASLAPSMPGASLWLLTLGGLWLCFWRTRWRWFGLLGVALAFAVMPLQRAPDLMISGDARALAVRTERGLVLYSTRGERIAGETWARRTGESSAERWPDGGSSTDGSLRCSGGLCVLERGDADIRLVMRPQALPNACAGATPVVSVVPLRNQCRAAAWTIDRFDLWRHGAHAVWLGEKGRPARIETTRQARGDRPWVPRADRRAQ